mmetsp:Transcript_15250/g.45197  ORF Transcript_15250/g.45197 Transcript_15250/m.45197 type:complete len:253 (-) Transcript_15250:694-1452(-)
MAFSPWTCRILSLVLPVRILQSSFLVTVPLPSESKTLKASHTTSSFRTLRLSSASARNSVYSMVSFPSVPIEAKEMSDGICTPALSKASRSSGTVMWPLPSRSSASKIWRRCCVSASLARQAKAVMAAFCNMFKVWKCIMVSTTSSRILASGRHAAFLSHGCSSAVHTSHRLSAFLRSNSASKVLASLDTFRQDLSLKLTGSLRMRLSNSSLVFPRNGYCPDRMMYITTPALQASHRWSYCTGAVTNSGATL